MDGFIVLAGLVAVWATLARIENSLKKIMAELQKQTNVLIPPPPLSPEEAELQERRARIAYVQENWPTYK
ncbi:MAG TPA: hypothetical protein VF532_04800 [Candidatus Angelobacter sp.]